MSFRNVCAYTQPNISAVDWHRKSPAPAETGRGDDRLNGVDMPDSTQSPSPELIAELARVINPEAFGEDADEVVDDPAVERAWASLYATRVAEWLVEHDHAATLHARQAYALEVGNALLAILPRVNPEDDRG